MMEFTKISFTFLLFGIVGFSLMIQMQLLEAAALSCDVSTEIYVGGNKTTVGDTGELCSNCWSSIQTLCNSKERPVSKIDCNWWDLGRNQRTTVCVGCCGAPHSPPLPVITAKCDAGDVDLTFGSPMTSGSNCGVCQKGCKTNCDARNGTVIRETCRFLSTAEPKVRYYYGCYCCCRLPPPPPPPSPPPPSPSPPPPSPPPPSPSPPPPSPPPPSPSPPPLPQPSPSVAFSCDLSTEISVGVNKTHTIQDGGMACKQCPGNIQTLCNSKGRTVSKIKCNWWDLDHSPQRRTVCLGCCGAPHPPPVPVITGKCQDGDTNLSFQAPAKSSLSGCRKCIKGCENKCKPRSETVSREMCVLEDNGSYDCDCCCRPPPPPKEDNLNLLSFIMDD